MAFAEGTYLIINVKSKMALDVAGANDYSGANVQQWNVNYSDAQVWSITPDGDYWQIICALSGKSLDLVNGATSSGTNIRQWDDNNSSAQRWKIVPDGKNITYNSVAYDTYYILSKANTGYAMEVVVGSTTAGANVQIWESNKTDAQRWIFVPAPCLRNNGTYIIHSALSDDRVLDVAGGSNAQGANVQIYSFNNTNAQIWNAVVHTENSQIILYRPESNLVIDVNGGSTRDGTNIQQWAYNGTSGQKWVFVASGTQKVNGVNRQLYEIRSVAGTSPTKCIDVAAGKTELSTNVQLWASNGTKAQRFWVEEGAYVTGSLASPIIRGLTNNLYRRGDLGVSEETEAQICIEYENPSTDVRVKCRYKYRKYYRNGVVTNWSSWLSGYDGTASNNGWGDSFNGYYDTSKGQIILPAKIPCQISNTKDGVENVEVQIEAEVIHIGGTYTYRSAVSAAAYNVYYVPALTVTSAYIGSSGLNIKVASDYSRNQNTYYANALGGTGSAKGMNTATVVIPWERLTRMPKSDETIPIALGITTKYTTVTGIASSAKVAFNTGVGIKIVKEETISEIGLLKLTVSSNLTGAYIAFSSGNRVRFEQVPYTVNSDGSHSVAYIYYPSNISYYIILHTGVKDSTSWGVTIFERSAKYFDKFIWAIPYSDVDVSYLTNGIMSLMIVNEDEGPEQTRSYSYETSSVSPNGRIRPMVKSHPVQSLDLSVSGLVPAKITDDIPNEMMTVDDMMKLSTCLGQGIYPLYRSPMGDWDYVAISKLTASQTKENWAKCSVTQEAVDFDVY